MSGQYDDSTVINQDSPPQDQSRIQNPFVEDNSKVYQIKKRFQLIKEQFQISQITKAEHQVSVFSPRKFKQKRKKSFNIKDKGPAVEILVD